MPALTARQCAGCVSFLRAKEEISMARKVGQIIARGGRRWLIRVYLGRDLEGAKIALNEYLDRWLETAVKPGVREKTWQDYEGMLHRYVRPRLGERLLTALRPLDLQTTYQQKMERGLCPRTVGYTHAVLRSAMRQALNWRLLLESPLDGLKLPRQSRHEMQALTLEQVRMFLKVALATPRGPVLAVAVATGCGRVSTWV